MTTEPNAELLQTCELKIVVAGKLWPVPALGMKGNKFVSPVVRKYFPIIQAWRRSGSNPSFTDLTDVITEQGLDDLFKATFWCLKRGHPTLTWEEFEEMPVTPPEVLLSFANISAATGLVTFAKDKEAPPLPKDPAPETSSQT